MKENLLKKLLCQFAIIENILYQKSFHRDVKAEGKIKLSVKTSIALDVVKILILMYFIVLFFVRLTVSVF